MARKILQHSFASGEVTPELLGRVDLSQRQRGLELCQNMLVLAHGPVVRRPGAKHVSQERSSVAHAKQRLVPFSLPDGSWCVLAVGSAVGAHVYKDGTPVMEAAKNVTAATFGSATLLTVAGHGYASGDRVRVSSGSTYPRLVSRDAFVIVVDANTLEIHADEGAHIDTTGCAAYGGTGIQVRRLVKIPGLTALNSVLDTFGYSQDGNVMLFTEPNVQALRLTYTSLTSWATAAASFVVPTNAPTGLAATVINTQGTTNGKQDTYAVTTLMPDGVTESVPSAPVTAAINRLDLAGSINRLTWSAVAGAYRYYVYKKHGGILAYIGQADTTTFDDINIVPDAQKTPPTLTNPVNTGAGDYPAASTNHEQRLWLAGMANKSQNIIATRTGTPDNVSASLPTQDDDSFEFKLASQTRGPIKHLVSTTDLLALTTEGVWRLYSDADQGLGPVTLRTQVQTFYGAADTRPVIVGNSVLYIRRNSARMLELRYAWENNSFAATDVSLLAPHLFQFRSFSDMTVSLDGEVFVWATRDDGILLCLTYVPDQEVYAWHQHVLAGGGKAESVVAIPEADGPAVYISVLRGTRRTVERIGSRNFPTQADGFYVDSGYTYNGAPANALQGLHALEGQVVTVVADGALHPPVTVANGVVLLNQPASKIHVGLDPVARIKTLPLVDSVPAYFQGTAKNVSRILLRLAGTNSVKVGVDFDSLTEPVMRPVSTPLGSPAPLQTAEVEAFVASAWNQDGSVCVEANPGVPLTITSLVAEVEEGG